MDESLKNLLKRLTLLKRIIKKQYPELTERLKEERVTNSKQNERKLSR